MTLARRYISYTKQVIELLDPLRFACKNKERDVTAKDDGVQMREENNVPAPKGNSNFTSGG